MVEDEWTNNKPEEGGGNGQKVRTLKMARTGAGGRDGRVQNGECMVTGMGETCGGSSCCCYTKLSRVHLVVLRAAGTGSRDVPTRPHHTSPHLENTALEQNTSCAAARRARKYATILLYHHLKIIVRIIGLHFVRTCQSTSNRASGRFWRTRALPQTKIFV